MRGVSAPIAAAVLSWLALAPAAQAALSSGDGAPVIAAVGELGDSGAADTYEVGVDALLTPEGYTSDDDAQIVVLATLRQPCDELLDPRVVVDQEQRAIGVTLLARAVDEPCVLETVGVDRTIDLGNLRAAQYSVIANDGWLVEPLRVAASERGAPARAFVEEAWVEHAPADPDVADAVDTWYVVVRGRVPECSDVTTIKVVDSGETVEVLPFLGPRAESDGQPKQDRCGPAGRPYWRRVALPAARPGHTLVQVRGTGDAINILIDGDE
jgi:hypothetical protein